uniref:EF-hand domain-containing protein n=1 Tax=Oncorhynchus tshawytscha TaxID=74940 RepID=A0AAZ3Q561_ONCTS
MDDGQQDQYEERLKEVFESFDATGAGSLCPEELSDLCQALHLEDSTPTLLHALLQNQDPLTGRVGFDQFKNALIVVLSTSIVATPEPSQETAPFVRGSKRYGRHSTPEFIDTVTDFSEVLSSNATDPEDHEDSTVPRKRERWNAHESGTEEYEAEGQLHLWNPDEPSTPRGSITPLSDHQEERFREACEELTMPWDGFASHHELLALCDHLGLEVRKESVTEDVLQVLSGDEVMSVQAFTSWVLNHAKPPTPSASTPYRQLKRLHSSQPFDETGRRTSAMTSTIGMRLFSTLDDGTGSAPAEDILDAWMEEGIENSPEILQALDFDLEGKVNLRELTVALENELLVTKNGIHQAALASFKAEIRYLLERVDRELREKEKTRSDLDKAEKLKTQLASEVDEHHSAIECMNDLNLRKLEQEHREKLVSVRSELIKEMDQIQQQTGQQREKLEAEMEKLRDDETFLRDHLSLTVKESRRLEMELLDSTEKLVEAENQVSKLQRNLDNILKEKFGDLDLGSAEFFLQEESLRRLRSSYEEQCRELQDRIDELQAELQEYHNLGRTSQLCLKPSLSEDLESKSPGMESDPGLGSEEGQPLFNMSLEAEMMLERLKEKHLREMEELQAQLESKVTDSYLREKAQLDEQSNESLQTVLEEEMLRLVKEQDSREIRLTEQWELEQVQLKECLEETLLTRLAEEKLKQQEQQEEVERRLREDWDRERLQLEEDYEGMLQEQLQEDRERLEGEKEEVEKRLEQMMEEEKERLEEAHRQAVQELSAKHSEEREQLSGLLDKLREDISHFSQKIREVEARFSGDQDAVAERFQTDVSNLEKHYQSELKALTDNHAEQKTKWDAETEEALQKAEAQRRVLQETREQERETITQDLVKERELLESVHKEEMGALVAKNHELQKELESFISLAQTKEIELSRQLNDLHNRLQENLDTKDELLAKSEKKTQEIELLLNQAVEDFKQERAELQGNLSELEVRHSLAEKQLKEMSELLSEHDNQKLKIKELENLLRQAAVDFQFERLELQENISDLELKLKESRPSSDLQDNEKGELLVERDQLSIRIQEIENELNQLLDSADITGGKEMGESNEVNVAPLGEENIEAAALEEQVGSENITVSDETCDNVVPEDCEGLDIEYVFPMEQGPNDKFEIITVSPHEMEISENIIAEVCDQEITVTSDNLNVLVEASETCGEQGQDDDVEMIPETPNRLEECPEDTITLHFDGICDDETTVDDGPDPVVESVAVEEQAQDDNASEVRMNAETSEDIEVCPENIISVEACNGEVAAIPEECQDLVEESQSSECQCQAEDNMDEDTNDDIVAMSIPEEKPQSDGIDGDVCPSEIKCEDSSPDKIGQNDASVQETVFDDKPEEEELQDDLINEEVKSYVSLVVSSALEEIGHDTDDTKVACLFEETQDLEKKPVELIPQLQQRCEEAVNERDDYIREILELHEQVSQLESEASLLAQLQSQYDTATEENLALQQKISELQQKSDALESLSAENDQQALEKNGTLKAQANEIKVTSSDMTSLQIRYEECICENAKLEEQNCRLEKRVVGLESKMHIIQDFQDQQVALVDEITRMREENCKLTELVSELERQDEILMALQLEAESEEDATTEQEQESFLDLNSQLEAKIQVVSELEDCCTEFEKQNAKLLVHHLECLFYVCQAKDKFVTWTIKFFRIHSDLLEFCKSMYFLGWKHNTGASKEKVPTFCKSIHDQSILLLFQTHVLDGSLQSVNLQNARLKSDLRVSQQEKDALKQEVMSLHKQLQNANDKNQVLEMALHSSGYQSQHKKLYRDELARLVEQEQQLLRQENERLTMELHNTKDDLHHSRDKVCEVQRELESLRQENEGLKTQQAQLQARLLEVSSLPTFPNFPQTYAPLI